MLEETLVLDGDKSFRQGCRNFLYRNDRSVGLRAYQFHCFFSVRIIEGGFDLGRHDIGNSDIRCTFENTTEAAVCGSYANTCDQDDANDHEPEYIKSDFFSDFNSIGADSFAQLFCITFAVIHSSTSSKPYYIKEMI